ncbi:MAG TPA: CoA ester lyase [Vicinamibacterales bacterium]|nr:CoA ester lyase [Vicinamibacterales bacterium]
MVLRSLLFVPGTSPDRFSKALASGADAALIDLEDAVDSSRKAEARELVGAWLKTTTASRTARFVRVNAPGSEWQEADLRWLARVAGYIDGVIVPKVEAADHIEQVARVAPHGRVCPMFETARAILDAPAIVRATADMPAIIFGAEDLTAQLGIPRTVNGEELVLARSQVVLAAATIGADAIDAVFVDLTASGDLFEDCRRAKAVGFRGKTAIHPNQIAVINDVFSPTGDEIARARRLIAADAAARAAGQGAFRFENRMVDQPVVTRARRVVELADKLTTNN